MKNQDIKNIPLEVINRIKSNRKTLISGYNIKIHSSTRDALHHIKQQNDLRSLSDTIDMLISYVAYSQLDKMDDSEFVKSTQIENVYGRGKHCIVKGREYYSIQAVANKYKIDRRTVDERIKSLRPKWRDWNFADEDVELKYDKRRIN
jgi:hypothetical protein